MFFREKKKYFLNRRAILILAAFFLVTPALNAAPSPDENLKISSIKVEGNQNVSNLLIFGHLQEKVGDVYSLSRVRMDIHNLFSMGNFKDVQVEALPGKKSDEVEIVFKVEERPLITKISFKGNKKWDAKKLLESMKSVPQAAFDQAKLNGDLAAIKKMYQDEGYPYITATSAARPDAQKNTVSVEINVEEGLQIKVGGVTVIGSQAFSGKKVAEQMKTNRQGEKYKPDLLDEDVRNIEAFYHDEGYLKAVVLSRAETLNEAKRKIYLTLTVQEGVQYTLGREANDIRFNGNVLMEDEELLKVLGLKKGEVMKEKNLDEGLRRIKTLYADKGYIYSTIVPKQEYDEDMKTVSLAIDITEGQVAYVQDVKIRGNYKTNDYVIRRELVIQPGDKFEADKIRQSAMNLYNLGFFDEVNPEVEAGDTPGKEVLVYRLKERKTGSISVGGGYSSVDGLVGNVKLDEANLFGKGQHVNLEVQFGARVTSYSIGFTEPWLFNTPTSLGVNIFNTTQSFYSAVADPTGSTKLYKEIQLGGSLSLGRKLSRYWSVYGTYSLSNVQITEVPDYYKTPGTPQYISESNKTTSSFTPRVVFDSRDNYFDPSRGWRHQLSIEVAGGLLGADNNFVKLIHDSSHFMPLPLGFVIGEHMRLGVAQGYWYPGKGFTEVPVYERFFAGGTDTIRGYNERTVGPVNGGNALWVSNTELKHVIVNPLRGVMFFDMGNSWTNLWNATSSESNIQFGAGLGVRLMIPGTMMDIRLDYGWPIGSTLPQAAAPPGGVLHFNLGNIF